MLKPRRTRDKVVTYVMTLGGTVVVLIAGSPWLSEKIGGFASVIDTAKTVGLWLSAAFSASYLVYSYVLWRIVFPNYDINGRWSYRNEYKTPIADGGDEPMRNNGGWIEIRQSLDLVVYSGKRTSRNDIDVKTDMNDFKSLAFDVSDDCLGVMLYEIVREGVTHRSMQVLHIGVRPSGHAPNTIIGRFRSLDADPAYEGKCEYTYEGPVTIFDHCVEILRALCGKSHAHARTKPNPSLPD